ncbi:MAG: diaminopimelate decarboxylase [Omnitrophica WOR_2 bacterium GWF2_38_59]|nr:MAG: diaminopimelate decarboxylase [Omnitrophica WOR_2 bacterium GWF2_38_59]OGX49301.1 MAG: diaminopimelate decarboxylase [Omnitrophica WOR_2 bacterium RIFOXYA2_FULL_38_17]OGX51468.1 MAG: diaminopimelate decarboxylase [Omnitrophica WOR_2 bacterium RIFOXYA12_FULL_38_10]OGX55884.1 MAG: diaminopimelate decarboxylase [Omnitrophica WOR_2 bacterium RIFOXYC2_FULL_38_12]OGX58225.1 MAG: diaminopimelate decarboxylase [Omnitrophica WOR_2 bacterium RIFOXYB2_FULL_38_16]HBG61879.1 diaminopimelate decarbo
MHDFKYKSGELYCENVKVSSIAEKVGTPFYLYSYKTLVDHFNKIQKAFKEIDALVCFAMKCNDNMAVVKSLVDQGAGCDIVSVGELKKALKVNADPQKIVFASVGKTEEEITAALKAGILFFNVESLPELEEINRISEKVHIKTQATLRINPDVKAVTNDRIATGTLDKKFGIDLENTRKILKRQKDFPNVKINGLHMHIGSQILSVKPYIFALKIINEFLKEIKKDGIKLEYLDIGGGIGINYKGNEANTVQKFADAIMPQLKKTGLKIIFEPGRFIAGNAGIFVTKVVYFKDNGVKKFIIVDAGMNDFMRPSLYNAYHEIIPLKKTSSKKVKVDVVGPICESGDFFAKDRMLPKLNKDDLIAIMGAGAYGYVMASNYNVRGRPAEVMVKGSIFETVKTRETFNDLTRGETIPGFIK